MKIETVILVILISLLLVGCNNDEYDQLKVLDGNGRLLLLEHNYGDNYFIYDISEQSSIVNDKINKKLPIK